jgi:riboflavin kinase/FMN adenylyltransferase
MHIVKGLDQLDRLPTGATISIGNFDGVHLGHQALLKLAGEVGVVGVAGGGKLMVVTFEPHPLTVLRPKHAPPRLTPPSLKHRLLAAAGVDYLLELAPTPDVLDLTAEEFWAILRDRLAPSALVEGSSFTFGKGRGGNIDSLRKWTAAAGIPLHIAGEVTVPLLNLCIVPVSSSIVRWLVTQGRMRDAAVCLGRPYSLAGKIIEGHRRGREIGIPTANLSIHNQHIPADAVYAGRCLVDETAWPAAVSIGNLPTFGDSDRQIEAHLIGFTGDLYGRELRVELLDWLREQRRYDGIAPLKTQIALDIAETLARQNDPIARSIAVAY